MPNIKSAVKRMRQNQDRRLRNRSNRTQMRSVVKKFRLLTEEDLEKARAYLPEVYSMIDKKARQGVIHSNTAARYKSRLTRHLARLESGS